VDNARVRKNASGRNGEQIPDASPQCLSRCRSSRLSRLSVVMLLATTWTTAGVQYLGVTHAVLISFQIDRIQDDLSGLLRFARLWDGIGAQNFVSAFVANRVVK